MEFHPQVPNGDSARLAAQVILGIGFLGVGAIIRYAANMMIFKIKEGKLIDEMLAVLTELEGIRMINYE